jgi:hypothetical protein
MKFSKTALLGTILMLVAFFFLWGKLNHSSVEFEKTKRIAEESKRARSVPSAPTVGKADQSAVASSKDVAPRADETKEVILEQIHTSSVTYDAKEIPKIAPFLNHEDPEVRRAAMDGMIILGDSSAGTWLRAASKTARTPQEAVAFEEAANYMELPPSKHFKLRKKESSKK